MDSELRELEEELGRLAPDALPDGLISRMEAAMDGWQEAEREEKVVPFPAAEGANGNGGLWRAAAAVAMLGAATALLVPGSGTPEISAAVNQSSTLSPVWGSAAAATPFSPVSAERDMVRANHEGLVLMGQDTPHRCVRVEYLERYEFKGEDGQSLRVSKPAVDYILIPVRAD